MLVVAAMVTATRLRAGAGVRVRAAEVRRPSQGPHHLGDGHNKLSMCMHTKLHALHVYAYKITNTPPSGCYY